MSHATGGTGGQPQRPQTTQRIQTEDPTSVRDTDDVTMSGVVRTWEKNEEPSSQEILDIQVQQKNLRYEILLLDLDVLLHFRKGLFTTTLSSNVANCVSNNYLGFRPSKCMGLLQWIQRRLRGEEGRRCQCYERQPD